MAEIQIKYKKHYCNHPFYDGQNFCRECTTCWADNVGCRYFDSGITDDGVIPFGNCTHTNYRYIYTGFTAKEYEVTTFEDCYNPHLNCAIVKVKSGKNKITKYDNCCKVIIDGECVYLNEEEE